MNSENEKLPVVTVICPVYNAQGYIRKLLDSLANLNYPDDKLEIVIVDNNSSDNTPTIISEYPFTLLHEKNVQSSYAARNKGIRAARGEVYAFIDADCIADKDWVFEGVKTLTEENADIAAGKVEFFYKGKKPTGTEIFDSVTHMQTESTIELGYAATANLFVRAELFNELGYFPNNVKSGGDTQWTSNATAKGKVLRLSEKAIVKHPSRDFGEFLRKVIRTGKGWPHGRFGKGEKIWHEILYIPYSFVFFFLGSKEYMNIYRRKVEGKFQISCFRFYLLGLFFKFVSRLASLLEFCRILLLGLHKNKSYRMTQK